MPRLFALCQPPPPPPESGNPRYQDVHVWGALLSCGRRNRPKSGLQLDNGGLSDVVSVHTQCVYWGLLRLPFQLIDRFSYFRGCVLPAPLLLPKTVPGTAEGTWAVPPHAKLGFVCNSLSSFGPLLHWLHVSSPKGALTHCHNSSPSNFHQGTVFGGVPCEKLAVLHHREFGKFRRLKGRH